MKKVLSLIFAVLLMISFCGCNKEADLEQFLDENYNTMVGEIRALFGANAEVCARVEDCSFVFEVKAPEFDNATDIQIQVIKDKLKDVIPDEELLEKSREANELVRNLKDYVVIVNDSSGKTLVKVSTMQE